MSDRSTPPRLRGLPLIGNLLELRRDPAALLRRVLAECGDVGLFRIGLRDVWVIAAAEHARTILVDEADAFEKGPVLRRYARAVLGDGLISVENARHRPRRRLVGHAFGPRALAGYTTIIEEVADDTLRGLRAGAVVDLREVMSRLTLRVVGRALFSADLGTEQPELTQAFGVVLRFVTSQIMRPLPLPKPWRVRRALQRLNETIARMIVARRQNPKPDLLTELVTARDDDGRPLPDRAIRDEAMNLFLAGFETSANGLSWTFHLLLRHPDAFERLGDDHYAARVFQEALRLYPPVHSIGRQSTRAVRLGAFTMPSGAVSVVSPFLMHRRPEYFRDPERFDPDRFLEAPPKFAYVPFGAGPRACVGAQLATNEATVVLTRFARRLVLEAVDAGPVEPEMLVTMRPSRPVLARITETRE